MLTASPLRARLRLVGNLLSALLLAVVVASGVGLVVVPKLTGSKPLAVLTGSMRPTYPPGAVVVVRPVDADELHVGDTLTYQIRSGEAEVITHRIVRISFGTDGRRRFVTRGDANGADDPDPVQEDQVRGTVWYSVPLVGYVSTALDPRHRRTAVLAVSGGLVVYGAYLFAGGLLERRRRSTPARA